MSDEKKTNALAAVWIPLGLVFGTGFGLVLDNLAVGIAVGLVFGAALAVGFWAHARRRGPDKAGEPQPGARTTHERRADVAD
jgi:hypothetical protein